MKEMREKIEKAIDLLSEAMRADHMVSEAAHFWVSDGAFGEIKVIADDRINKAFAAMRDIPAEGKLSSWQYGGFPPLMGSDVPASLLHICIHEAAQGKFRRPAPLQEIPEEFDTFFEAPSAETIAEYEFRRNFADTIDVINFWSMP